MNKAKLFLLSLSCLAVFICLGNAYGQSNYPEELFDECVNVAGKSFCDFLFKRNTVDPTNLTALTQSNYTEPTNSTYSTNSTYLTYNDNDLGFSMQYPSDWTINEEESEVYTVIGFDPPNEDAMVDIRILPKGDYNSIKEYGDYFKEYEGYTLLSYYRNSSTLLDGKPAFKATYLSTSNPSLFENALGQKSWTAKAKFIATMVPEKESFFAIAYFAKSNNFDKYLPVVEKMIESFKISAKGPIIQEDNSSSSSP